MTATNHYDVIIIGSGAGGGTLAYRLAPSGKRILLLERGGYVPREKDNWDSHAVNVAAKYQTREVWRDAEGKPLHPHTNYYVGGNTKFYGAALFRLRREDFGVLPHHGGVSPAWPIGYDELEPYYTEAEQLYQVHGTRGEDPTEPQASAAYAHPAVSHEPRMQQLHDSLAAAGLRPFHTPLGIMLDEGNPQSSRCIRCNSCDGFACLVKAKSDAQVVCVDPALTYPNVTLLTGATVTRLETSPTGREVSRVIVDHAGVEEALTADIVVASCGAINSAALLLRSANGKHPRGLANASDVVGRHYMGHTNSVLLAISRTPNPTVFQKTLALNDFYFGSAKFRLSDGPHLVCRQARRRRAVGGCARAGTRHHARHHGQTLARLLAHVRGSAGPGQSRLARRRRQHRPQLPAEQPRRTQAADDEARIPARASRLRASPAAAQSVRRPAHPAGWRGTSERNDPFRSTTLAVRRSIATAKRTSSTISMSSTRASSRLQAR